MRTTIELKGFEELDKKFAQIKSASETVLKPAAVDGAQVIQEKASSKAPGPHVEIDVTKQTATKVEVSIGPDKAHWFYQFFETGADAHEIDPKNRDALSFIGSEGRVYFAEVAHPGMVAEPFLRPAMDEAKDEAVAAVGATVRRVIEAL